ncbi:MAG TPA: DUF975 family protein [Clostridia bacterium]
MKRCKDYRRLGWNAVSQYWIKAILFNLLAMIITSGLTSTVIGFFILGPFNVGMYLFYLRSVRREDASYGSLFEPIIKGDFLRTIILHLLKVVYTILWTMLLFIPGIIKSYSYAMAEFIAIDNPNMSANDCITASRQLMRGKKFKLFLLDLSFIGWIILCIIPFVSLFVMPYMNATRAAFYNDIKSELRK